jgi:hypothetical protein
MSSAPLAISITAESHFENFTCAKLWLKTKPTPFCRRRKSRNSHQNSHSTKIKMAANLAAAHLIYFV